MSAENRVPVFRQRGMCWAASQRLPVPTQNHARLCFV
jgi:hypothetical protein